MGGDSLDESWNQRFWQIVPHARFDHQLSAGDIPSGVFPMFDRHQRIVGPVYDQRRRDNSLESFDPAPVS